VKQIRPLCRQNLANEKRSAQSPNSQALQDVIAVLAGAGAGAVDVELEAAQLVCWV
jgi:hypothetical protein